MQYVMPIYHGTALEREAALPEEEQKRVYADYQGINQTPGVTPGLPIACPRTRPPCGSKAARPWRQTARSSGSRRASAAGSSSRLTTSTRAIEVATRVLAARFGGAVEIRPSEVYW